MKENNTWPWSSRTCNLVRQESPGVAAMGEEETCSVKKVGRAGVVAQCGKYRPLGLVPFLWL